MLGQNDLLENKPESQIHPPGSTWEQLIQHQPPHHPQQRYRSLTSRFTRGARRGPRAAGVEQPPWARLFDSAAPRGKTSSSEGARALPISPTNVP